MRRLRSVALLGGLVVASLGSFVIAQPSPGPWGARTQAAARAAAPGQPAFNPRDLDGTWRGDLPGNGRWDNATPEPRLTEWAKQNLLYKSISHDPFEGTLVNPNRPFVRSAPAPQHNFFKADQNGVPANDNNGEYPGKDCEPLSVPAMYDYPNLGPMELLTTREGDRIFQFFEYHREWRTFWLNREHPGDLDPTYMGHSVARWEGNTLVVDTVGFNDKTMVSGSVGHRKSEAFRLVERFQRTAQDLLQIDMTYYDAKAWGEGQSWPGFRKHYRLASKEDTQEFICSPRDYHTYERTVIDPINERDKK